MTKFLITGLPRSRTAWWSVATTGPWSICHHEPLTWCENFAAVKSCWDSTNAYVGVSDSGMAPLLGRILEEVKPRTLIVQRDINEVQASLERAFKGYNLDTKAGFNFLKQSVVHLQRHANHPLVRLIRADAGLDEIHAAYRWLMPGNPQPFKEELFHMIVTVDPVYVMGPVVAAYPSWQRT